MPNNWWFHPLLIVISIWSVLLFVTFYLTKYEEK